MVDQKTVRTYAVNQVFRFVECIWLQRQSRQMRKGFRKRPVLLHTRATCSELPSYGDTPKSYPYIIFNPILYNHHATDRAIKSLPRVTMEV